MTNVTALREPTPVKRKPFIWDILHLLLATLVVGLVGGAVLMRLAVYWITPVVPTPPTIDAFAIAGWPAKLSCEEVRDGFGGVTVRFSASRTPDQGSDAKETWTMTGTMATGKKVIGEFVSKPVDGPASHYRTDGTGNVEKGATDAALGDTAYSIMEPVAWGCRKLLMDVPGVSG